jgi:Na+:H+ antiporter, NhaA family
MKLTKLYLEFFESEKAGGFLLIFCTVLSLLITNSPVQSAYLNIWHLQIADHSVTHWINDGLMTIFFLLIGLELEREIYKGELSNIKNALLPIVAALGGMLMPAAIYLFLNYGTPTQAGAGIPMATDIAFAIGVLSLLGSRVPAQLKIFLTALAVIDDLGAIITITLFYSNGISILYLTLAIIIFALLLLLNRLKVYALLPYLVGGMAMWYCMMHSGVHATISGVMLAFAIPFKNGQKDSPSTRLEHFLHKPVTFFILPLFALANTSIIIHANWAMGLNTTNNLGIFAGLILGKPAGIILFSVIAVASGLCSLPEGLTWKQITGAGFLGGIGFTMSIFITLLAFDNPGIITSTKIAILLSSVTAAVIGFCWLRFTLKK